MISLYQRRWPLGWLYILTLGIDAALAGRLAWVFLVDFKDYQRTASWYWLPAGLWWLLASIGVLALVAGVVTAFRRRVGRTAAWLGLSVLAMGSCAAMSIPVVVTIGGGVSAGDPPGVYEQ